MHQRIEITRADFEANFGLTTDPYSMGVCVYGPSSNPALIVEYLFVEPKDEIAILEELYAL